MTDEELLSEVQKYYERIEHPFSYSIAGRLDVLGDDSNAITYSDNVHMAIGAGICCTEILNRFGTEL